MPQISCGARGRVAEQPRRRVVRADAEELARRFQVPLAPVRTVFDALAERPLSGPYATPDGRLSALQRDGVPLELVGVSRPRAGQTAPGG